MSRTKPRLARTRLFVQDTAMRVEKDSLGEFPVPAGAARRALAGGISLAEALEAGGAVPAGGFIAAAGPRADDAPGTCKSQALERE